MPENIKPQKPLFVKATPQKYENDLKKALSLFRDVRRKAVIENINPIAMRVALKFAQITDDYFAKQRLSPEEEAWIEQEAKRLFEQVKPKINEG